MKTMSVNRYEEHTIILEEGIDFDKSELVHDRFSGTQLELPINRLMQIAKAKGFDNWTFNGHYKAKHRSIPVRFAKFI